MQENQRPGWLRRSLIGGGVALLLLGGGAVAFAQTQTTPPANGFQTFLDDVASHLGVTPAALQGAVKQAEIDQVNQAVKNGKMTQQQAQKIESAINAGKMRWGPFFGDRGRHGPRLGVRFGLMQQAATYLGITPQELRTQLQSGKTLAQIADSTSGKSATGLQQYLLAQIQTKLDTAVKNGKITQAQATDMLTKTKTRIGDLMNQKFQFQEGRPGTWHQQKPAPSPSGSGA